MANTFSNQLTANLPTSLQTVLTGPVGAGSTTTVIGCSMSNTSASPITVDLAINTGAASIYLVKQATVPVGGALIAIGAEQKLVLQPTQNLQARASSANTCDVVVSALTVS